MLLMEERRDLILEQLYKEGAVYVSELAQKFSVSYETIRKDLSALEEKGLLIKSHGGATIKQNAIEHPFNIREKENIEFKKLIAKKAISLIPDNSSIIIGTGSTTLELAILLAERSGHKIFTDSLPVASFLINSNNQVFLFGGQLRPQSSSVFGGWTASLISQIHVDISFIGTDGFSNIDGPTSPSSSDAYIDKIILEHSEKKYVLGDYSKFDRTSLYKICDWNKIDGLITNNQVSNEKLKKLGTLTTVYTC